jgi:hypothetical protein
VYYFITPLSAFDASRVWEASTYDAGYVLRFFQEVLSRIGLDAGAQKELVMPFINVPVPTNVYTFGYVAFSDFGFLFPIYFMLVGLLVGFTFALPRRIPSVRVLQGFCYYPIIMTLYQDQFLTIMSTWVQIILVLGICHAFTHVETRREISSPDRSENSKHAEVSLQWKP